MDFSLILLLLVLLTGGTWAAYVWIIRPKQGEEAVEPVVVEYARAFFPVILFVFLLRSFLVEPFHIPTGSMLPGLMPGDYILVNKYSYGIRLPVVNIKVLPVGEVKRGDVVVFRYPEDPSTNYIKRAIGLPGDRVVYVDKTLYINGKRMEQYGAAPEMMRDDSGRLNRMRRLTENLDGVEHNIYIDPVSESRYLERVVPEGHYFVMGDNRDRSHDSRYWGFVPDENLLGRAFMIWYSRDKRAVGGWFWQHIQWERIGDSIH